MHNRKRTRRELFNIFIRTLKNFNNISYQYDVPSLSISYRLFFLVERDHLNSSADASEYSVFCDQLRFEQQLNLLIKMLLKIILIAFVYILYYITELKSEEAQNEERLGNVTVKNGNISQIHFIVKDPNSHVVQAQLNMIR